MNMSFNQDCFATWKSTYKWNSNLIPISNTDRIHYLGEAALTSYRQHQYCLHLSESTTVSVTCRSHKQPSLQVAAKYCLFLVNALAPQWLKPVTQETPLPCELSIQALICSQLNSALKVLKQPSRSDNFICSGTAHSESRKTLLSTTGQSLLISPKLISNIQESLSLYLAN